MTFRPDLNPVDRCRRLASVKIVLWLLIALIGTALLTPSTPLFAVGLRQDDPPLYTIEAGETLSEIAKERGIPLGDLMRYNGIADADAIYVGQVLRLPVTDDSAIEDEDPTEISTTEPAVSDVEVSADSDVNDTVDSDENGEDRASAVEKPTIERRHNSIATLNRGYTVQSGDTLAAIALRNGVDEGALRRLNDLGSETWLVAGHKLLLPATGDDLTVERSLQDYVVAPGDSLSLIARAFDVPLPALLQTNHIADANAIRAGQRLIIPGQVVETSSDPRDKAQVGPAQVGLAQSGFFYYTVQSGDTLSEIARDFATSILALLEYNNLPNEETVYAGLELRIPFGPPPLPQHPLPLPSSGSSFLVSLSRQQCWVFHGDRVAHSWNCSTGYGEWITRTGSFQVQTKLENAKSGAYRLDMPYWLGIYDVGEYENGIHGLPVSWETGEKLWDSLVGQPATFGCAMLGDEDAEALFELAYLGMPVYVVP